jgi:hypothetical protein
MIRENLRGVIERMEKMRAQALMRAETAKAQAQAYAEVIEELRRLDGIALADEVLRGRVRQLDEDGGTRPAPEVGDLPPSTGDKNQRCTTKPIDEPPPTDPHPDDKPPEQRKGSPPCPLCACGTIVVRKTGRLICLNEECPNSRIGQETAKAQVKGKTQAPPEEAEEDHGGGKILDIGDGRQELAEGTNLAACITAIQFRAPHWLTTSGILEVVRQHLRKDLPETMAQIIGQEMTKQRKSRTYRVAGLQARQVDARRWEYRVTEASKHGGD